jgi:outer membrane protein assembly factor BamD
MRLMLFKMGIFVLVTFFILFDCGHKVKKENLGPQEYFDFAKSLLDKGKCVSAITEFTVIVLKFSGHLIVDDAQFYLAESHFKCEEFLIAAAEYQKLINDYPESPYVEQAFFKIGSSYLKLSQRPELDQEYTSKSLRQFQVFIEAYPNSSYRDEAEKKMAILRKKLAKKQLLGANVYRKMGIYDSAVIYYDILLEKYYDTPQAEEAMFYKAECQFKLKKYNLAITNYTAFIEKYPESKYARKAKEKITEIQELLKEAEISKDESEG